MQPLIGDGSSDDRCGDPVGHNTARIRLHRHRVRLARRELDHGVTEGIASRDQHRRRTQVSPRRQSCYGHAVGSRAGVGCQREATQISSEGDNRPVCYRVKPLIGDGGSDDRCGDPVGHNTARIRLHRHRVRLAWRELDHGVTEGIASHDQHRGRTQVSPRRQSCHGHAVGSRAGVWCQREATQISRESDHCAISYRMQPLIGDGSSDDRCGDPVGHNTARIRLHRHRVRLARRELDHGVTEGIASRDQHRRRTQVSPRRQSCYGHAVGSRAGVGCQREATQISREGDNRPVCYRVKPPIGDGGSDDRRGDSIGHNTVRIRLHHHRVRLAWRELDHGVTEGITSRDQHRRRTQVSACHQGCYGHAAASRAGVWCRREATQISSKGNNHPV